MPASDLGQPLLVNLLVGVDDVVEPGCAICLESRSAVTEHTFLLGRLKAAGVNLAHSVDCAHHYLVEVPSDQQIRLLAQRDLDDAPYELADFIVQMKISGEYQNDPSKGNSANSSRENQ